MGAAEHGHTGGVTTLGQYLRARREQLQPSDVGLPDLGGHRRRTPGLRREEVATLAGVSIDYLVRLEQGRDTHPSPSVVSALAAALQLSESQRRDLWQLASINHAGEFCPEAQVPTTEVTPTVQAILDGLAPTPALVIGARLDVLAWNAAWERVASGIGFFDDSPPNLARHAFRQPPGGWDEVADEVVNRLRGAKPCGDEEQLAALVEELSVSNEFRRRWARFAGEPSRTGDVRATHPELGPLRFTYEMMAIGDDDQQLVTWHAADAATRAAFAGASSAARAPLRLAR